MESYSGFRVTTRCAVYFVQNTHMMMALETSCGIGLSPWPSTSIMSQGSEVAAIHSKLDQILAAYASATTPRGSTPPPSIFSPAPDSKQALAAAQLDTADSIMPGGKAAAGWDDAAAESRAAGSFALSPASSAAADAEVSFASDSAADDTKLVAPTPKGVKFLLDDVSVGHQNPRADAEVVNTDAPAEAAAQAPASAADKAAGAAATSQKLPKLSAWSRLRSKAASSSSDTSDSQRPAGKAQSDLLAAVKIRGISKASAIDHVDSAADSTIQHGMAPTSAAAASPSTAALGAGPVSSAPSMSVSGAAAETEVQDAGGKTDIMSVHAAKPRSSLKKMLRRALH